MANSTASRGHGSKFRKTSGTNSTLVAQIMDITGPGLESDDIDISNMDSTNRYREFISGMIDAGEITLDCVYSKAQFNTIKGWVGGNTTTSNNDTFELELSDRTNTSGTGSVLAFGGYVKGIDLAVPFEDKITAKTTVKLSGEVTFTASS